jgi:hypothetical protein
MPVSSFFVTIKLINDVSFCFIHLSFYLFVGLSPLSLWSLYYSSLTFIWTCSLCMLVVALVVVALLVVALVVVALLVVALVVVALLVVALMVVRTVVTTAVETTISGSENNGNYISGEISGEDCGNCIGGRNSIDLSFETRVDRDEPMYQKAW